MSSPATEVPVLKKTLIAIAVLVLLVVIYLVIRGISSRAGSPPGLADGQLKPCPPTPNCVCSEYPQDSEHAIAALEFGNRSATGALSSLRSIALKSGARIESESEGYLALSFKSAIFGFVDDLELRVDENARLVHLRSAARVGRSDLGVNRARVEAIRQKYAAVDG